MHIARYVILDADFVWLVSSLNVIQQEAKETNIYQFQEEYLKFSEVTLIATGISTATSGHVK